jgi:hypothetical protein
MRISQELAKQISFKLTEKSKSHVEALKKEYYKLAQHYYEAQIPDDIKNAFKKHPEWFYTRQIIEFSGHGFNWENIKADAPVICNDGTSAHLKLNEKSSSKLSTAKNKYKKAEEQYDSLRTETEQALLTLKTYKNIREELPEAAPYLPPPISNALVVNFDSLKKRLDKQKEINYNVNA